MPQPHDEPPDEYPLSPDEPSPDEPSPDEPSPEIERPLPTPAIASDEPPVNAERDQFSLGELLGLVAVTAVLLSAISSIARWTKMGNSPAVLATAYATVFGFSALVSMIVLAWMPQARRIVTLGWWVLLALYIVTAAAAVLMSK